MSDLILPELRSLQGKKEHLPSEAESPGFKGDNPLLTVDPTDHSPDADRETLQSHSGHITHAPAYNNLPIRLLICLQRK